MKVLVADDTEHVRYLVTELLRGEPEIEGVLQAMDGVEAIEIVRRERPRVVILDVMMPHLDGLQTARLIKEEWPETRVLVMTSMREKSFERDAYAYGADGFLDKAALTTELAPAVRRLLT